MFGVQIPLKRVVLKLGLTAVLHTESDDRIRIISVRKATKKERKQYASNE
jgi:uncharacterized DUF497 family protein